MIIVGEGRRRPIIVLLATVVAAVVATLAPAPARADDPVTPPLSRIVACGTLLCTESGPWSMHAGTVYTSLDVPEVVLPLLQAAGANTVRITDFFPEEAPAASLLDDEASWTRLDRFIAAAQAAGLYSIIDLSTYRNALLREGLDPYAHDWLPFLLKLAGRVNTVTGVAYPDDPAIAMVLLAGEPLPTTSPSASERMYWFFRTNLHRLRLLLPSTLVSSGGFIHLDWDSGIPWRAIASMSEQQVCSVHVYGRGMLDAARRMARLCRDLGKPWIAEEFGLPANVGDGVRAAWFDRVFRLARRQGAAGVGVWNIGPSTEATTSDVNPGFPLAWAALTTGFARSNASAVVGLGEHARQRGRPRMPG